MIYLLFLCNTAVFIINALSEYIIIFLIYMRSQSLIKNINFPSPSQQHLFSDDVWMDAMAGQ